MQVKRQNRSGKNKADAGMGILIVLEWLLSIAQGFFW